MTEFLRGESGRTGFSGEFKLEMKSAFLPGGSRVKNPPTKQETGSVPGLGRSLGQGNGNLIQYSCLGNPMDRGA